MMSRKFMKEEYLRPTDLVSMVVEIIPQLDLIDLDRLLLFAEQEIQYRQNKGLLDE